MWLEKLHCISVEPKFMSNSFGEKTVKFETFDVEITSAIWLKLDGIIALANLE